MYWYQLIILYLRPGLKPKPWYLHVTSFILKYVVTQTRPKVGDSLKTVLDIIFKGLQQQYPVLLLLSFNTIPHSLGTKSFTRQKETFRELA